MNVSLTKAQEKYIARRVKNQEYQTASELVREAVRMHVEHEEARLANLKAAVRRGVDDGKHGRYTTVRTSEELRAFLDSIAKRGAAELAAEKRKARRK